MPDYDDFDGSPGPYYDNALRHYEESGTNARILDGSTARACSRCDAGGCYGTTLEPLGGGEWGCVGGCVGVALPLAA